MYTCNLHIHSLNKYNLKTTLNTECVMCTYCVPYTKNTEMRKTWWVYSRWCKSRPQKKSAGCMPGLQPAILPTLSLLPSCELSFLISARTAQERNGTILDDRLQRPLRRGRNCALAVPTLQPGQRGPCNPEATEQQEGPAQGWTRVWYFGDLWTSLSLHWASLSGEEGRLD